MANLEEHCVHSFERYGIRAMDIHQWIDEPVKVAGASHRKFRHTVDVIGIAIKVFNGRYTTEEIENVVLDHLLIDHERNRKAKIDRNSIARDHCLAIPTTATDDSALIIWSPERLYWPWSVGVLRRTLTRSKVTKGQSVSSWLLEEDFLPFKLNLGWCWLDRIAIELRVRELRGRSKTQI